MIDDPVLIVVDVQRDFVEFDDETRAREAGNVVERINEFATEYRDSGRTPIFVRTIHGEHVDSGTWKEKYESQDRQPPCLKGTSGSEFAAGLDVLDSDVIVTKNRYDAFYNTNLQTYLDSNDVSEVLICGVKTEVCVESTVRAAYNRDYDVTVLTDCCFTDNERQRALAHERMDRNFGRARKSTEIDM